MKKKQLKKNLEIENNFWKFVQFLHEQGCIVTCEYEDYNKGFSAKIESDYIRGCMWMYKFDGSRVYNGVVIDNKKCWNKLSQCPLRMKIPSPKKFNAYLERFLYWGTRKGYDASSKFDYSQFDCDGT